MTGAAHRISIFAIGVMTAVALAAAGLRLLEWPAWQEAAVWANGLPLMPTADAYAWLAGAEGTGRLAGWPMAVLIDGVAKVTGAAPQSIALWLPVVLAPIPGVLVAALCIRKGHAAAGLVAGTFAAGSLGYLARTRMGYADTDLFALALVVGFAWACAAAAQKLKQMGAEGTLPRQVGVCLVACIAVFWGWMVLYPSGYPLALAILLVAGLYTCLAADRGKFGAFLVAFGTILAAGHFGWVGPAIGLAVLWLWWAGWLRPNLALGAALFGILVIAVGLGQSEFLEQTLRRIAAYTGLGPAPAPVGDWLLPQVDNSIQETVHLGLVRYAERVGSHWSLLVGGLAGYALVLWRWPALVTFLPLLVLGLSGYFLGHRFAFYAAPVLGLGLGLGLAIVAGRMGLNQRTAMLVQLILAVTLAGFLGWRALDLRPDPVLSPAHAGALQQLRDEPSENGRLWAWWDEGYPAQFYGGLPTLADGGNASRQRIFLLGQVFGAYSALKASQLMKLAAMARVEEMEGQENWREVTYANRPLALLVGQPAAEVQRELDRLGEHVRDWPNDLPDEFLVVSWPVLRQAQWISYFGRWSLVDGERGYGQIATLSPPVELDESNGLLHTPDGVVPLASLDILDTGSHYRNQWPRNDGAHAVINNANGEGVLMDSSLYQMMAVQMLIAEPEQFDQHFELVSDGFPAARVYRLR